MANFPLKIIFFGTAELACASLRSLAANPELFRVEAVITQPDKPRGRDLQLQPTAVKTAAETLGLPVLQPKKARDPEFLEQIRKLAPGLMVVVAYGQILPKGLLEIPPHGCVNVHTSLLPRHRGAAPIQWALLSGDPETGVTIMQMDEGLDTGPILSTSRTVIAPEDNAQTLHDRLAEMGASLLVQTIPGWVRGEIKAIPQPEGATYARKISKEDGRILWEEPVRSIWNKIRAFTPWPGAFTFVGGTGKPRMLKIWEAVPEELPQSPTEEAKKEVPGTVLGAGSEGILVSCGEGALRIKTLQLEGRRRMGAQEFLAGNPLEKGSVL